MDYNKLLKDELQLLANQIKDQVIANLHSEKGVNQKTGQNTLIGSNLEKSIDAKVRGENEIVFVIADYYTYIVGGRRVGWGTPPPSGFVPAIIKWVKQKGIRFDGMTQNQTAWACIKSIVKRRIQGRNKLGNGYENDDPTFVLPFLEEFFEKWAEDVFEDMLQEITNFFTR